ncbi:MAG: phosphoenolpyruvate--protein phosphotransferase [Mariprofundaceae bacterium]
MKHRRAAGFDMRPRREGGSVAASSGVIIGRVKKRVYGALKVPQREVLSTQLNHEASRLLKAVEAAVTEIDVERKHLLESRNHDSLPLLDAHKMLLSDPELMSSAQARIMDACINAEWALRQEMDAVKEVFDAMEDEYLRQRREDIEQAGSRILRHLMHDRNGSSDLAPDAGELPVIYVGDDFSPPDVVSLWRRGVGGLVAEQGGADAHNIIVSRGVGMPALVGAAGILDDVENGDTIILDAEQGRWVLNPSDEEQVSYQKFMRAMDVLQDSLQSFAGQPSVSRDGHAMTLMANIEFPEELEIAERIGIDGIGLYRTEFLFMDAPVLPDEDTQYQQYVRLLQAVPGKPVTMRLLDIGGDKVGLYKGILGRDFGGSNPAMGLRGVRLLLSPPEWLDTQLRAMVRASREGPLQILIPMVTRCDEVIRVREMVDACCRSLGLSENIGVGTMIEVPAAVMIADELAEVSDFFSIGTNDLMQYTLAADRTDEDVADIYAAEHPAIRKLIRKTVKAAKKAGIPVAVCGELAANSTWTETFLRMDMDALSMSLNQILSIRRQLSKSTFRPSA